MCCCAARGSPASFDGQATKVQEELSHEDRMALAQMEESKAEQDKLLDQIGVVVTNLGVLATGIGEVLRCTSRSSSHLAQL